MGDGAHKVLVIGYGNPGRLDDGLGPALAGRIEGLGIPGVTVDADYQLLVEDAAQVAEHDIVVFADADTSCAPPFYFKQLTPVPALSFSSHSVRPEALLALAHDLFGAKTRGYVLGIRGQEFNEFGERLSDDATAHLEAAVAFLERALREQDFSEVNADGATPGAPPHQEGR